MECAATRVSSAGERDTCDTAKHAGSDDFQVAAIGAVQESLRPSSSVRQCVRSVALQSIRKGCQRMRSAQLWSGSLYFVAAEGTRRARFFLCRRHLQSARLLPSAATVFRKPLESILCETAAAARGVDRSVALPSCAAPPPCAARESYATNTCSRVRRFGNRRAYFATPIA